MTINLTKNHIVFLTSIFLSCVSFASYAQDVNTLRTQYPGQAEVVSEYSEHYTISLTKENKVKISQENYEESTIITDKGTGFSTNESIMFSTLNHLKTYEAYTLNNINGRQRKTEIAQITEKKLDQQSVFDSDVKLKVFTYSNLTLGSQKILKYTIDFKDPNLLHRFMFASSYPSLSRTLKLSFPENIKIDYKIFNYDEKLVEKEVITNKGITTLTFRVQPKSQLKNDDSAAGLMYEAPHLHFWISEYTVNGETIPMLGSIDKLYNYYSKFIKNINKEIDKPLHNFTQELIKDATTDDEKMKLIFEWVQKNIKYVAFESGYEGFVPRNAKNVFIRKYGDCKDMASIITEMAKYADVPNVNFTWIGSRELPYKYNELSTPAVDNHMIATYIKDDQIIYLDATDENVPYGFPSSFTQGKEALIAQGNTYKLAVVPEISSEYNSINDIITLSLDQNKIVGNGIYTANGLLASSFRNSIGDNQKNRKDFAIALLKKGSNKFKLNDYNEIDFAFKDKPYGINYSFELDNYVVNAGSESYVNLTLDKPFQNSILEKNRVQTLELNYLQKQLYKVTLEVPSNHKVTYVPENKSFSNELLAYDFNYTLVNDKVELSYTIEIKKTLIAPNEFLLWNESIKKLKENYLETIIIKHI